MRLSRCARLVASPFLTWFSHRDTPARVGTVRFASQSSYFVVGAVGVQQVCLLGIDPPDASECCKSVQSELTVDRTDFGRPDQTRMRNRHRMQRSFKCLEPKRQKPIEDGELWAEIIVLPNKGL